MKHPAIIVASIGVAVLAAGGGITAAAASSTPATSAAPATSSMPAAGGAGGAGVRTAMATVGGKPETILVTRPGMPLYIYRPDTATTSLVSGGLARAWPPLTAAPVAGAGVTGKVGVLRDASGRQVTYNGHPLYTFVDDHSGQVTGQGVQNFFVATPGIAVLGGATGSAPAAPAAPSRGYGY
jgi:predicted lipoprotein with Yx(FWY)xxD motif